MTVATDLQNVSTAARRPIPRGDWTAIESIADEPCLPTEAGDWRLDGLLAEGALSRVFAARPSGHSLNHPAQYVLKMLHPRWERQSEAVSLFHREAKVGRAIDHPHVVPVLAGHVHEAPYFIVMPRLKGQTVSARLEREQVLPARPALWIARQLAEGLAAMHRRGYLHGDVKPANVFLAPSGHATLIDLGFARPLHDVGSAIDRAGLGTINYLAPELLISALRADERSDIYSLGATLYEMLAGRPPLIADTLAGLLNLHHATEPASLRAIRPDLSPEVATLTRQMLSREPLRRPQSMAEVVQRLMGLEIEALAECR